MAYGKAGPFLGVTGLLQWLDFGSGMPRSPCWNLRLQNGLGGYNPTFITLSPSHQVRCALWSDSSPSFSQLSPHFSLQVFPLKKNPLCLIVAWHLFLREPGQVHSLIPLLT